MVERPSISKQIAEARDKGDLSENAEYAAAKDAQGMLELKFPNCRISFRMQEYLMSQNWSIQSFADVDGDDKEPKE